jgi:hypothetical protein
MRGMRTRFLSYQIISDKTVIMTHRKINEEIINVYDTILIVDKKHSEYQIRQEQYTAAAQVRLSDQ